MGRKEENKKGSSRSVENFLEEQPQQRDPVAAPIKEPIQEEVELEPIPQEEPIQETPPTKEKISTTPPAYTDDPKEVNRQAWAIEGRVPVAAFKPAKWIKAKNLARDLGRKGVEPHQVNQVCFIDNYEDAAQMYREQAEKYNKSLK